MRITFEPIERAKWLFPARDCLAFYADADGRYVRCVVSREFLGAGLVGPASREEAIEAFRRRPEIEGRLRKMIEEGGLDENGEAFL